MLVYYIIYAIDEFIPNFSIDKFTTQSEVCPITNYELFEEVDGLEIH